MKRPEDAETEKIKQDSFDEKQQKKTDPATPQMRKKLARIYSNAKPKTLLCEQCNLAVCGKKALEVHKRKHTGERPFSCTECNRSFSQMNNLRQHQQNLHEGNKRKTKKSVRPYRFQCDDCKKLFISPVDLRAHKRIHSGDKPFVCEHCQRGFTQKGNLNMHVRRWHSSQQQHRKSDPATFRLFEFSKFMVQKPDNKRDDSTPPDVTPTYLKFKQQVAPPRPNARHTVQETLLYSPVFPTLNFQNLDDNFGSCENTLFANFPEITAIQVVSAAAEDIRVDTSNEIVSRDNEVQSVATEGHTKENSDVSDICGTSYNLTTKEAAFEPMDHMYLNNEQAMLLTHDQIKALSSFHINDFIQNMSEHASPQKESPSKTHVIVNNSIEVDTTNLSDSLFSSSYSNTSTIETPQKYSMADDNELNEDDETRESEFNWFQPPFQSVRVIKNVSGGEIKDINTSPLLDVVAFEDELSPSVPMLAYSQLSNEN